MANSANLSNANDLSQRFALDVQGFDSLRAQAKQSPQAGAKLVAGQFDAMFTQMMLKSMRDATPEGGLFDSHTSKMYTSMLDQQLAQQMSSRGIGVADALMKQLMRNTNSGAGADAAAGALGAAGLGEGGNEGSLVAMNAMAKAYANAAANNGNLRGRLRVMLAGRTPAMARLATVDAIMERVLGARERSLLAAVPALLETHFERLRDAGQPAPDDTRDSEEAVAPGPWLDVFRSDMQSVLLAELEVRFQSVEGLLEALRAS